MEDIFYTFYRCRIPISVKRFPPKARLGQVKGLEANLPYPGDSKACCDTTRPGQYYSHAYFFYQAAALSCGLKDVVTGVTRLNTYAISRYMIVESTCLVIMFNFGSRVSGSGQEVSVKDFSTSLELGNCRYQPHASESKLNRRSRLLSLTCDHNPLSPTKKRGESLC
ncbi:jg18137 [Pararge aegeria aegeria]|uniref:Jg18137 protein n=1 Tax=Pararge aegeria aegeria TaxID=348720 RepID=A0A8S4S3S7_9NEOP|nr:jg18137 [Pararge aegeria aegeria]